MGRVSPLECPSSEIELVPVVFRVDRWDRCRGVRLPYGMAAGKVGLIRRAAAMTRIGTPTVMEVEI